MPRKTNTATAYEVEHKQPLQKAPTKSTRNKYLNINAPFVPSRSSHTLNLKPTHKAIKAYYDEIERYSQHTRVEGAVAPAFANLLRHCAQRFDWTLVEKYTLKREGRNLYLDGALLNNFKLIHGIWEAKDSKDDLDREVHKKFDAGYPQDNIIFQAPHRAIIWQNGRKALDTDIARPEALVEALKLFFAYERPTIEKWQKAVEEFKDEVPKLGAALLERIENERRSNKRFVQAFEEFNSVCRQLINPKLAVQDVEKMLIQHILTERIFRTVFNNPEFVERNAIAHEIEKVIHVLTSRSYTRHEFLKPLDRFYKAIEKTAADIEDFSQKQHFLNVVYEKFFQGFSVKVADTHGIVYTPPPIVDFMVKSVEAILQKEFRRSLSDKDVHILDPFVGTGNFIMRIMREIQPSKLPYKYTHEIHCNEIMLLPYYIASMNIEHEYNELTKNYQPFEGICLVDTFELAEEKEMRKELFTKENTKRVIRQKSTPIFVIIGNPPYNMGQANENDNNKNREYEQIDRRVAETYAKDSRATNRNKLSDPYIKALRWASDRIVKTGEGIVAFVTNDSFIDGIAFDGVRKHLDQDFDEIYVLNLGGNVRKNPSLSGTKHNVFGITVGVSINFLVKKRGTSACKIFYASTEEFWKKEEKFTFLNKIQSTRGIEWKLLTPDENYTWLTDKLQSDFKTFLPLGDKANKKRMKTESKTIFKLYSLGVATNRDLYVYSFDLTSLSQHANTFIDAYNAKLDIWKRQSNRSSIEDVIDVADVGIKWTRQTKRALQNASYTDFMISGIRLSIYRPFTKRYLYYDDFWNEEQYQTPRIFPAPECEAQNLVICLSAIGHKTPFHCLMANVIPNLHLTGDSQCFPFYTYDKAGDNRQENITDWALEQFQIHYQDKRISKWYIFYYIYAILHHPEYRKKYAANLRRELPRIPLTTDFQVFAKAGEKLSDLHVKYEEQCEYPLTHIESSPLNWRVQKMKLSKDKTQLVYNDFLTLADIPSEAFEYRLGNRSALEWIIDQYQVKTDKRSGIVNDPNRPEEPEYIVRLVKKIITVSLKTREVINALPKLD